MRASSILSRLVAPLAAIVIVLAAGAAATSPAFAQASAPVLNAASGTAAVPATTLPPITPPASIANPYGLRALWEQGDWVARATLLILAIMSLGSWYVLISKLVAQSRMGGQGRAANQSFWKADTIRGGGTRCKRQARIASSPNPRSRPRASTTA